jgi:hypothetical protein
VRAQLQADVLQADPGWRSRGKPIPTAADRFATDAFAKWGRLQGCDRAADIEQMLEETGRGYLAGYD